MRSHSFMLVWVILFVFPVFGFALNTNASPDSYTFSPEPELELESDLLLPLDDDQTESLTQFDHSSDFIFPGEAEDVALADDLGSGNFLSEDESSIFSRPLAASDLSFDQDFSSTDFASFDLADCSTSASLLSPSLSDIGDKSRKEIHNDDSNSCRNPSSPNAKPIVLPTLNHPDDYHDDEPFTAEDDPTIPLTGGLGSAVLGLSFYSDCAIVTSYALPVIYCNSGSKEDVVYNGKQDFQFRGKFDTWTLLRYQKGMSALIGFLIQKLFNLFESFFSFPCTRFLTKNDKKKFEGEEEEEGYEEEEGENENMRKKKGKKRKKRQR